MGLFKWICKHFKCTSNCSFNDESELQPDFFNKKLSSFSIRKRDVNKLLKILNKENEELQISEKINISNI